MRNRIFKGLSLLAGLAIVTASMTVAAKAKHVEPSYSENFPPGIDGYKYMGDADYAQLKKAAKSDAKSRKLAEVDSLDEEQILSADLKNLRNELLGGPEYSEGKKSATKFAGISTADELDALIVKLEANYEKLSNDAKFVAAPLIALKPYRGIVVRLRPLFKDGLIKSGHVRGAPVTHAAVLTVLRMAAAGVNVFTPTPQWKAGFAYFTEPSANLGSDISSDMALKRFVAYESLPAIEKLRDRMAALNLEKPIYFDNKLMLSKANFVADKDRFLMIGEAERKAVLSAILLFHSGVNGSMAYSWDGLIAACDSVANVYGFQQTFAAEGATAKDRTAQLNKFRNKLFVFDKTNGKVWMDRSFRSLKEGIRQGKLSWMATQDYNQSSNGINMLFDPRVAMPFGRVINTGFENLESMIEGTGVKSAVVAGEVVDVNLTKFFTDPPDSMLAFLPTRFVEGKNEAVLHGKTYRDLTIGTPNGWNTSVYQKYFPSVKSDDDVKAAARILSQSWGGWVLGLPLTAMVL